MTITTAKLKEILELHRKWLRQEEGGQRADLSCANLRYANLSYANLWGADLSYADLSYADLSYANLSHANLSYANLSYADLSRADLSYADLSRADLRAADLWGANLSRADLSYADLSYADLTDAKGCGHDDLAHLFQIPQEGEIIGWGKKAGVLVKMRVPAEAKRTGNIRNRKCRAEFVEVLAIAADDVAVPGVEATIRSVVVQNDYGRTEYKVGCITRPHAYDSDHLQDCRPGIHFFLTRQEAERWT